MSTWRLVQVGGGLQSSWRLHRVTGSSTSTTVWRLIGLSSVNTAQWRLLGLTGVQLTPVKWRLQSLSGSSDPIPSAAVYPLEIEAYDTVTIDIHTLPSPYTFTQVSGPSVTIVAAGGVASYQYPGIDAVEGSHVVVSYTAGGGAYSGTADTKGYPIQEYVLDDTLTWQPVAPEVIL